MSTYQNDVRRAAPPAVLLSEDIQAILGLRTRSSAARLISRGDLGAPIRLGRRLAVLRETFFAALQARERETGVHVLRDGRSPRGMGNE